MQVELNGENHKVAYIEYYKGLPFLAFTTKDGKCFSTWDIFPNEGDENDLVLYNSGGGSIYSTNNPDSKYWLNSEINLPFNLDLEKIDTPIVFNGSENPFDYAYISNSLEYCDRCKHSSVDVCTEHTYWNEEANEDRYKDDDSPVY